MTLSFHDNLHVSIDRLIQNHDTSESMILIHRLLTEEKFHPYEICLVQVLLVLDHDRQLQFCEEMIRRCDENIEFPRNICSGETTFYINGDTITVFGPTINNPHWICEAHTQQLQQVNVWEGIINNQILRASRF